MAVYPFKARRRPDSAGCRTEIIRDKSKGITMNRCYRLVWNRARRLFVVASEISRGRGKAGRTVRARHLAWLAALPLSLSPMLSMAAAQVAISDVMPVPRMALPTPPVAAPIVSGTASPSGGQVTGGSGNIGQSGLTTTINQHSQNLSLNWQSFNIGADSTVNFVQPNAQSIAVNRIADANGSVILGRLNANGQVFLINPNGVLFGQGAQVNVGGLVASTLDIGDGELASGTRHFGGNDSGRGSVVNRGTINAANGGYVALLGPQVTNHGTLNAPGGTVALAGGNAVTLSFDSNRLLSLQVDKSALNALADNRQLIVANGGQVLMSAGAKNSLLASVVNNSGTIQAQTVENRAGKIVLLGGMAVGTTNVAGTLDASAPEGGDGGFIETSAALVHVADDATVTTLSGDGHTGDWLIDPHDFTIAASGGDLTGATLSANLGGTNVEIQSSSGTSVGSGNISVNDVVGWAADTVLTLTASNDVNINAHLTATGNSAGLVLNPNTANGADPASGTGTYSLNNGASITLSGLNPSLSIAGTVYTVINSVGVAGDITTTSMQGIDNNRYGHYALGVDLDASATSSWNGGDGFDPIGDGSGHFYGSFDGLGHTITGLTINRPTIDHVGLFGIAGLSSEIRNVDLLGGSVLGGNFVGNLIARSKGAVRNVSATGTVSGNSYVGGLIGIIESGSVTRAHATGAVSGVSSIVGGLAGYNLSGTISQTYATGAVSGNGLVGGLIGYNYAGMINQSYATGAASTNYGSVGGLVGTNDGTIEQTYATGAVSAINGNAGGLVGQSGGTVTDSYWDTQTTGQTASAGGTAKTTAQLQAALSAGFDASVWGIVAGQSYGYLLSQFVPGAAPQVVSGIVYNDGGATPAGAGISVLGLVDGTTLTSTLTGGDVITGANGYYYYLLAPDTLNSGGSQLLTWALAGGAQPAGAAFTDNISTSISGANGLDIHGDALHVQTASTAWSAVQANLLSALGGNVATGAFVSGLQDMHIDVGGAFAFDVASPSLVAGNLILNADDDITQTTAVTVAGTSSIDAGTGAITLTNAGNDFGDAVSLAGGATQIRDTNALTLGALATGDLTATSGGAMNLGSGMVSGNLVANSNNGAITQDTTTGKQLIVTGTSNINAGSTVITLANAANDFQGAVTATGAGMTLVDGNNLTMAALTNTGNGNVSLTAAGVLSVPSGSIDTGTGHLTLASNGGALVSNGALSGTNVSLTGRDGVTLVDNVTAQGTLTLTSTNAAIVQTAGSISAAGATTVNTGTGAIVLTSASNDFGGVVSLMGGATQIIDANTLTLGTINANSLTALAVAGTITLTGQVTTSGMQHYNSAVTLGADSELSGSDITFDSTVNGTHALSINASAVATFGGAVGDTTALTSLATDGGGTTTLNGDVSTIGAQIYNDAIILGGDASLTSIGAGAISLTNTVDGAHSLAVNTAGVTTFGGMVGAATALTSLTTAASGGTTIGGDVSTTGAQTYNDAVTMASDVILASHGGGSIDLNNAGNGAYHLVVNTAGVATFGGAVGAVVGLAGLTTSSGSFSAAALNIGGPLAVTTSAGGITQHGAFTVLGTSSFNSGIGAIVLTNAGNDFGGVVSLMGGATQIADSSALVLGSVQTSDLTATAAGNLALDGPIAVSADIDLTAGGAIAINTDIVDTAASLTLDAGTSISDTHAIDVASFTLNGGDWSQLYVALPTFKATSFTLAGGSFLRALGGDGSIITPYQLADIYVLQGVGGTGMLGHHYILANDIDASATSGWNGGAGFAPLGDDTTMFTGTFDGLGHTISNLTLNRPTESNIGLFGSIQSGAAVRNLGLIGGSISGLSQVGALAGENKGTISNSYATVNINGIGSVGGLVGSNGGTISNSYATGNINDITRVDVGVISSIGGLVGFNDAVIDNSYSTGNVNGTNYMGGLVGSNEPGGMVSNSYATGNVVGDYSYRGNYFNGGLVGFNTAQISTSYATGSVIDNIYNGGLVGYSAGGGTITNSYWNSTTNAKGIGVNNNSATATGLTTAEMMQSASFSSWDIANAGGSSAIWRIYDGYTAPLLRVFMTDLTVTGNNVSAVYNGTAFAGSSAFTLGSVTPGVWHPSTTADPGLVLGNLTTATPAIGAGSYALTGNLYSSQTGYDIDFAGGGTLTITPLAITIGGSALDKIYDGTTTATVTSLTSSGVIAGDVVTFSGGSGDFDDKNVGSGKTVTITGVTIGGADAGNYTITIGSSSTTAAITPKTITVDADADDKIYDGTTTATLGSVTSSGVIAGDNVTFSGGTGQFNNKNAGSNKTVTVTGIAANGIDAGNYSFNTTANTTANISPLGITVGATSSDKVYDATTHAVIALGSSGLLAGDAVTLTGTGHFADKNVGAAQAVTVDVEAQGADAGNYLFRPAPGTVADITPATLVYQADPASFPSGGDWGSLGGAVSGLVGGETLADATAGTLTWQTPATTTTPAGTYAIEGSGLSARNYVFVQSPGNANALQLIASGAPAPLAVPGLIGPAVASLQQTDDTDEAPTLSAPNVRIVNGGVRLP